MGGVWSPTDGVICATDLAQALAAGAQANGAHIVENCKVTGLIRERGRILGVMTEQGEISASTVVLAAGMWSRDFAAQNGVAVPLHAVERFYAVTDRLYNVPADLPVLRDPDESLFIYPKPDSGCLIVSGFPAASKPWGVEGIPENFCFPKLPPDLESLQPLLNRAAIRVPALKDAPVQSYFTAPEAYTPDGSAIIGPALELPGLFVAAGFCLMGINAAGGAGKAISDWIIDGQPGPDMAGSGTAPSRFLPFQANKTFLRDRVRSVPGDFYAMHWPYRQPATARGARRSILHDRLASRGACFGDAHGWEVPNWYALPGQAPEYQHSYGRQNWFEASAREHRAVREQVGLIDRSSIAKYHVQGPGALTLLNLMSTADIDVDPGRTVFTHWLNTQGGIEASVFVSRFSEQDFLVTTAANGQARDLSFLREANNKYLQSNRGAMQCGIVDVTSGYASLGLFGPLARALMTHLTPDDVSGDKFRRWDCGEIEIGYARVLASRASYIGEQGWDLLIPTEFAPGVFDRIMAAGEEFGLQLFGFHAQDSLRLEKAFPYWGVDVFSDMTPLEAGSELAVAMDKLGGFVGREALARQTAGGVRRHLVQFLLLDPSYDLFGDEPIWHDGMRVGRVTSGAFGHTLGAAVALGLVRGAVHNGDIYEIEIAGKRVPARMSMEPMFDPDEERLAA